MALSESASKKKLFIGLPIPPELLDEFKSVIKKLKISADKKEIPIKWVQPENYHITLKFLGDTDKIADIEKTIEKLCKKLESTNISPRMLGAYPSKIKARVLWIGARKHSNMARMQSLLNAEFLKLGFPEDEYEFQPHITIGRIRNFRSTSDLISPFARKKFKSFPMDKIVLYESTVQNHTAVHIPIKEWKLDSESIESKAI